MRMNKISADIGVRKQNGENKRNIEKTT